MMPSFVRVLATTAVLVAAAGTAPAQDNALPPLPEPGVPEVLTLEGTFIRAAFNNEGYVVLGYRLANQSPGEPWMLIDVGIALRKGQARQELSRDELSLSTPDGKTLALPSDDEHRRASLTALQARARTAGDALVMPGEVNLRCTNGVFFYDDAAGARAAEAGGGAAQEALPFTAGCGWFGRLYFQVPGGIQHGQHFLNVKFDSTMIRVPFRIMTGDEEKAFRKNYGKIKKQIEAAFQPKKR